MALIFCTSGVPNDTFTVGEWIADFLFFNDYRLSFEDAKEAFKRDVKRGRIVLSPQKQRRAFGRASRHRAPRRAG